MSTPGRATRSSKREAPLDAQTTPTAKRIKEELDGSKLEGTGGLLTPPSTAVKLEDVKVEGSPSSAKKASAQLAKKLKQLDSFKQTPYPTFSRPSAEECQTVHDLLSSVHGTPVRPKVVVDTAGAGCGNAPTVLDALVRTILSQNTTAKNSNAAKAKMDEKYGRANYEAVRLATVEELAEEIKCGGLAVNKSKSIKKVIDDVYAKTGKVSLEYLREMGDEEAMRELVSFNGVGPKTASCVLLFCLNRESFAVDTHVFRLSKSLGWVPGAATRETTFQHLDVRIPPHLKYGLHVLLVSHGRSCERCSANGVTTQRKVECPLVGVSAALRKGSPSKAKKEEDAEGEVKYEPLADEWQLSGNTGLPPAVKAEELKEDPAGAV